MTIDDFIAANAGVRWHTKRRFRGHNGVIGDASDGSTVWVIILGNRNVSCTAPMSRANILEAIRNLEDAQPGTEFKTVGADRHAALFRLTGLTMIADANGDPRAIFRGETA